MSNDELNADVLKGFSPLDGLKRDNLAALARKVQLRELSPGQVLFKEGDTEKRTFYIASGILELIDQGKVVEYQIKLQASFKVCLVEVLLGECAGSLIGFGYFQYSIIC